MIDLQPPRLTKLDLSAPFIVDGVLKPTEGPHSTGYTGKEFARSSQQGPNVRAMQQWSKLRDIQVDTESTLGPRQLANDCVFGKWSIGDDRSGIQQTLINEIKCFVIDVLAEAQIVGINAD